MLRDGRGGKKDLEKAEHYAALAFSQGLAELPTTQNRAPITQPRALGREFVTIRAARLPDQREVAAFQADKYPVTREFWNEIMGGMPEQVPAHLRTSWNNCPTCPVTYVNWENGDHSRAEVQTFRVNLNQIEQTTGCTYDLPTEAQLWSMIRCDETGTNQDLYSRGVTAANVNEYVTYSGNSNGRIQPVGLKTPNLCGIELGNVWKLSKDLYDPAHPHWGRSIRGGSWDDVVGYSESAERNGASAGYRGGSVGFSLVRRCGP
jgi:formylglycine-generating enzyme required for sulfatase activity